MAKPDPEAFVTTSSLRGIIARSQAPRTHRSQSSTNLMMGSRRFVSFLSKSNIGPRLLSMAMEPTSTNPARALTIAFATKIINSALGSRFRNPTKNGRPKDVEEARRFKATKGGCGGEWKLRG